MLKFNIALIGPQGCGKTTMAEALSAPYDHLSPDGRKLAGLHRVSFADALRLEVADAYVHRFGEPYTSWKGDLRERCLMEMLDPVLKKNWRPVLQSWGVLRRERDGEDYWATRLAWRMNEPGSYVVDDCRFPNEYKMLRDHGFIFVRLAPHKEVPQLDHESERYWPTFEYDVCLSGSTEERMAWLKTWLEENGHETW